MYVSALLLIAIWVVSRFWLLRTLNSMNILYVHPCIHIHTFLLGLCLGEESQRCGIWNIFNPAIRVLFLWLCMLSSPNAKQLPAGIHTGGLTIDRDSDLCTTQHRLGGAQAQRLSLKGVSAVLSQAAAPLAAWPQRGVRSWCSEEYMWLCGVLCVSEKIILYIL